MKILIYGLPKSGTTILNFRIREAMEGVLGLPSVPNIFEPIERRRDGGQVVYRKADGWEGNEEEHLLVKALLPMHAGQGLQPNDVLEQFADFDSTVYIQRDPRDRWVSHFFYRWFHGHHPERTAFERALRLTRHKEAHPGDLPFYALLEMNPEGLDVWKQEQLELCRRVVDFLEVARERGWQVVRYEDLIDDQVTALNEYLGFAISDTRETDPSFARVGRAKRYGDWRRWFTEDDVPVFREIYGELLAALGYDTKDWRLETTETLPAAEGSEYMLRLFTPPDDGSRRRWRLFRK